MRLIVPGVVVVAKWEGKLDKHQFDEAMAGRSVRVVPLDIWADPAGGPILPAGPRTAAATASGRRRRVLLP